MHACFSQKQAAGVFAAFILRKKKSRTARCICIVLGFAVMTFAAHLGGEMVYGHRVGVDRTDGEAFPEHFVPLMPESGRLYCPWHASRFALAVGRVVNGPAAHPEPCLTVRIRDGEIEVRKAEPDGAKPSATAAIAGQPA